MRLTLEEELEIRLMRLIYAKDIMGWSADLDGNVFNRKGEKIGYLNKGYLVSTYRIKAKTYQISLHQFVYFYFTGEVVEQIDHKNQTRSDNRFENLRSLTNQQNQFNTNAKGYYWHKNAQKWLAKIKINGKSIHLGLFPTKEEARQAYLEAKKIYHKI